MRKKQILSTLALAFLTVVVMAQPYELEWCMDINTVVQKIRSKGLTIKDQSTLSLDSRHLKNNYAGEVLVVGQTPSLPLVFMHFKSDVLYKIREVLPLDQWTLYQTMHQNQDQNALPGLSNRSIIEINRSDTFFEVVYSPTENPY